MISLEYIRLTLNCFDLNFEAVGLPFQQIYQCKELIHGRTFQIRQDHMTVKIYCAFKLHLNLDIFRNFDSILIY